MVGDDLYKSLACLLYGVPYEQVTEEQRTEAKKKFWKKAYGGDDYLDDAVKNLEEAVRNLDWGECIERMSKEFNIPIIHLDPSKWKVVQDSNLPCVIENPHRRKG